MPNFSGSLGCNYMGMSALIGAGIILTIIGVAIAVFFTQFLIIGGIFFSRDNLL